MDFSDRKCCEDGLGTKKSVSYYHKIAVQLILNLSVFSLFCFLSLCLFVARRLLLARQTERQTKRLRIRINLAD